LENWDRGYLKFLWSLIIQALLEVLAILKRTIIIDRGRNQNCQRTPYHISKEAELIVDLALT
jgi:hypothetical protein